jgi:hypothetical protein
MCSGCARPVARCVSRPPLDVARSASVKSHRRARRRSCKPCCPRAARSKSTHSSCDRARGPQRSSTLLTHTVTAESHLRHAPAAAERAPGRALRVDHAQHEAGARFCTAFAPRSRARAQVESRPTAEVNFGYNWHSLLTPGERPVVRSPMVWRASRVRSAVSAARGRVAVTRRAHV